MTSQIAQIKANIETECRAINQALTGYAALAKHSIINHRYQALNTHKEELGKIVGKDEACRIMTHIYTDVLDNNKQSQEGENNNVKL